MTKTDVYVGDLLPGDMITSIDALDSWFWLIVSVQTERNHPRRDVWLFIEGKVSRFNWPNGCMVHLIQRCEVSR